MDNLFDDLIPKTEASAEAPADNPFEDLIPKPVGTLQGFFNTVRSALKNTGQALDVLGLSKVQQEPSIRQEYRAFRESMDDPRYMHALISGEGDIAKLTGPEAKLEAIRLPAETEKEEFVSRISKREREIKDIRPSKAMQDWHAAKGADAVTTFLKDPIEITANIVAQGFAGSIPAVAAGAAGGAVAGPAGSAVGAGSGSYFVEYANNILQSIRDSGVDLTDERQVRKAFKDERLMADAKQRASTRGVPVAVFDAASAGLAGKFFGAAGKTVAAKALATGKEAAFQAGMGAAGEAAGQKIVGEPLDLKAIFEEAVGELGPGAVEVGVNLARQKFLTRPRNNFDDLVPGQRDLELNAARTYLAEAQKGAQNAIQEPSAETVHVRQAPEDRQEVVDGVRPTEGAPGAIAQEAPVSAGAAVETAASQTNPEPTPAQKEAGNFAKGKVNIQGLEIAIETPKGAIRSGTNKQGEAWQVEMPTHYGYILGTQGKDKDHIDVYIGPNPEAGNVFVVDQLNEEGKFDEHKVMLGYADPGAALNDYHRAFSDGKGLQRIGAMQVMPMEDFKQWLKEGNTTKPLRLKEGSTPSPSPVIPAGKPSVETPPANFEVSTPPAVGKKPIIARGQWDIIDASEVGYVGGMTDLQERNRRSQQSKEQISVIAAGLDPRYLGNSATAAEGAPILDANGDRIAGYGRLAAIKQAYEAAGIPGDIYREFVQREAQRLGIAGKLEGKSNPILVRRVQAYDGGTREAFAADSNQEQALQFTPTEIALSDARVIMENRLMDIFAITEEGSISRQFLDQLYNGMKNRGGLRSTDGAQYLPQMYARAKVAILTALLNKAKNPEVLIRNVVERAEELGLTKKLNGLMQASARLLSVASLDEHYSIGEHLAIGLQDYIEARKLYGTTKGDLKDFMEQGTLFANDRTTESGVILELLWDAKSAKAVSEFFLEYARRAEALARDTATPEMFGDLPKATVLQLLQASKPNAEPTQSELLGSRSGNETESSEPSSTRAGSKPDKAKDAKEGTYPKEDAYPSAARPGTALNVPRGTRNVLEQIASSSENPFYRDLANLFIERKVFPKIEQSTREEARKRTGGKVLESYAALYDYGLDTIFVFEPTEHAVLHEVAHSGTLDALETNQEFRAQMDAIYSEAQKHPEFSNLYAANNVYEFVSEGLTNPDLQRLLNSIRTPKSPRTLWQRIVAAVRKLFGGKSEESLFDRFLREVEPGIQSQSGAGQGQFPMVAVTPGVGGRALTRSEIEGQLDFEQQTQNAQVSTLLELMERHGTSPANPILKNLGYDDLNAIQVQTGKARQSYEQFKLANPGAAYTPAVALETSLKLILERNKWRNLRSKLSEITDLIKSRTFQNKIQRLEAKAIQKEALDAAWDNFRASIKDAIEQTKTALQGEAANEERARQLLTQISSLESVEGYHVAMERAVEDIVNALANAPGLNALLASTPSGAEIVATYNRIRASQGANPVASDIAVQWAGELLGRSWAEAQRMILGALIKGNLELQSEMTAYEKAIFKGLRDHPRATMDEILRAARKTTKAGTLATVAWKKLRTEVSRELEEWDNLQQATQIIDDIEADPQYKAHTNLVFQDAKVEDRPDATAEVNGKRVSVADLNYDAIAGKPIFPLPDGSVVQVDLVGDVADFDKERAKMDAARDQLLAWKNAQDALPLEQRDTSYQFFVSHLRALEGIYLSTRVTHPSSLVSIGNPFSAEQPGSWDMPTFLLDDLGTRVGGAAKVAASIFNRVHALGRNLLVRQNDLANKMYAAAKGYDFKGGNNERALQLYDHVLQPLFAAAQRPGFKLSVGMIVGEGYRVSKEVVTLLQTQRDLAEQAFKIVQEQVPKERQTSAFPEVITDQINGVQWHGQAIKVNDTTLPFSGFAENALAFVENYRGKKARGDSAGALSELSRNFDFIFSYLTDRASIVENGASPYENAYKLVVSRIRTLKPTSAQRNLGWVAQQVGDINGVPVDDVLKQIAKELDTVIESFAAMRQMDEESNPTVSVSQPHQQSSFTARRHDRAFPYYFVRYGWRTGANFLDFIGNVHAHSFERFIQALGEVQKDLERQRDELSVRYESRLHELLAGGTAEPKARRQAYKEVLQANRIAHLNGETTDQFRSLQKRLHMVKKTIESQKDIFTGNREAEMDIRTWAKVSRATVGSLLTPVTVLVRNGTGLAYIGSVMARLRRNAAVSSVQVTARLVWDGLLRQGLAVPTFKALKYAMGRGGLEPWFEGVLNRLDRTKRLEENGLISPLDVWNEFTSKMRNLVHGGIVIDEKKGVGEKAVMTLVGLFDSLLLTAVAKPLFPRLGDTIINGTSDAATVGLVKELEKTLRELFRAWGSKIDSRFDFANPTAAKNALSHEEVYPSKLFGTSARQKMEYLRQTFEWSGVTFDQAAFEYLQKLKAGDVNASLLSPEQMIGLTDQILGLVNVPHALNRPAWAHKRDIFHQLFSPLVGWNIHALRQFVRYFSRPGVAPGESRAVMWLVMGMVLLPTLLALNTGQDIGTEELIRMLYRLMGKERSTRQPWEQPPNRVALGLLLSAVNPIPYVSMAVNAGLNDSPTRASFDPTPVVINKIKDVATYVGGVIQTGDPNYGLERVLSSFIPLLAPVLAKLPNQEGIQDALNARRLLTRFGDPDLLRPRYQGAQPATPLTPYGQRLMNAAMKGDDADFTSIYQEAVAKAREMGKPNPEQAVRQAFLAANPYDRAFKQKLSPEQREELLGKMDSRERSIVENAEEKFSHAASLIGASPTFERTPSQGAGTRTAGGSPLRPSRFARGSTARVSAGRLRRPRLARGRRTAKARRTRPRSVGIRRLSRGLRR